ncbi:MAG: enoyl-CoA hydratase/isomerase family protein [Alphaproteobacteria bacterium]|nr:enoyl-CoA hydratase/isomerase family protein [Alphaproteobacteria bacterium]
MSENHLLVEVRDQVLYATLNRPEKHNALSLALLADLRKLFESQAGDDTLLAAVLTGTGEKTFAAGGDLRELAALRTAPEAEQMARDAKAALNAIRTFPVPVIAALNGNTFGGAAELAVACDFRIAAAHARIGFVQGRLALSTAWGGGPDLLQLLGRAQGLRLMVTGEMVPSGEAWAIGLVDRVASENDGLEEVVEEFLEPMRQQAPQVMRVFKALSDAHRRGDSRETMQEIETKMFVETWVHDDHWEAAEKVLPSRK